MSSSFAAISPEKWSFFWRERRIVNKRIKLVSQSCFVLASFWPLLDWKTGNLVVKGVRLGAQGKIHVTVVPSQHEL